MKPKVKKNNLLEVTMSEYTVIFIIEVSVDKSWAIFYFNFPHRVYKRTICSMINYSSFLDFRIGDLV